LRVFFCFRSVRFPLAIRFRSSIPRPLPNPFFARSIPTSQRGTAITTKANSCPSLHGAACTAPSHHSLSPIQYTAGFMCQSILCSPSWYLSHHDPIPPPERSGGSPPARAAFLCRHSACVDGIHLSAASAGQAVAW
jgi:hypothetical protein